MEPPLSGIRGNYRRGSVDEFLRERVRNGSDLSCVSAFFTIYAFEALKEELSKIDRLRFLFGEQMDHYSDLLTQTVKSIQHACRRRVATDLRSGRGFVVPEAGDQAAEAAELDFITWPVILDPECPDG